MLPRDFEISPVRRVRAQNILRPFSVANFAPFWGEGGSKKVEGAKCILRPFSRKMGAKEAQNYFAPIFPENGRIMHFAPGRRAQGAFYPRPNP